MVDESPRYGLRVLCVVLDDTEFRKNIVPIFKYDLGGYARKKAVAFVHERGVHLFDASFHEDAFKNPGKWILIAKYEEQGLPRYVQYRRNP